VQEQVTIALESSHFEAKIPPSKADYFGVGYDPAEENAEMNAHRGSKRQLKGKGAGVYRMDALKSLTASDNQNEHSRNFSDIISARDVAGFSMNDEEDDVYDNKPGGKSMSSSSVTYLEEVVSDEDDERVGDVTSGGYNTKKANSMKKDLDDSVNKWLGSKAGESRVLERCPTDGKVVLDGFTLATLTQKMQQVSFATPQAPRDFIPGHVFPEDIEKTVTSSSSSDRQGRGQDGGAANVNASILPPKQPQIAHVSVFDIISEDSKRKIQSAIDGKKAVAPIEVSADPSGGSRPMLTSDAAMKSTFAGLAQAFQNRFVSSSSATPTDATIVNPGIGTAAEYASATSTAPNPVVLDEKKTTATKGETARAVSVPGSTASFLLNSNMNSIPKQEALNRYASPGSTIQVSEKVAASAVSKDLPSSVASGPVAKAYTSLKGKSSRTTTPWYPVPLLSRRFHIKVDGVNIGMKNGRLQQGDVPRVVDSKLEGMFAGMRESTYDVTQNFSQNQNKNENLNDDDVTGDTLKLNTYEDQAQAVEEVAAKPAMSLFKSIFEDSDSDDNSESDDENDVEVEVEVVKRGEGRANIRKEEVKVADPSSKESTTLSQSSSSQVNKKDTPHTGGEFLRNRFASQVKDVIAPAVTTADSKSERSFTKRSSTVVAAPVKVVVEEEDEDAGTRVVFRKPVVKAKVNMFSSAKPKRTFSAMSRDEDDGDDVGENEDADVVPSAVVKSKKRLLKLPGMTVVKAVTSSIEKDSEVQRLLKEMEEGTIEEAERKAANVSATAYFLNCITESSKADVVAQIAAAEAAAAEIIALSENEIEEGIETENFVFNPEAGTEESEIVSSWYKKSEEIIREKILQEQVVLEDIEIVDMGDEKDRNKEGKRKHKKDKKEEKSKKHSHHSHSDRKASEMKKSKKEKSKKEKKKREHDTPDRSPGWSKSGSETD
jgi:hypothetical protein